MSQTTATLEDVFSKMIDMHNKSQSSQYSQAIRDVLDLFGIEYSLQHALPVLHQPSSTRPRDWFSDPFDTDLFEQMRAGRN